MALHSFKIQNNRSIRLAEVTQVPKLMIIAGPNGVGKSTLLYAIKSGPRQEDAHTRILYLGPHRVIRSTQVRRSWLGGQLKTMLELLGASDVSGFDGLSFQNSARTPSNVDEAGSTIKHILGKVENRRQSRLAAAIDKHQRAGTSLNVGDLPDVYAPLRRLTDFILPHLKFKEVSFKDEENVRCLFTRSDRGGEVDVDIDELSSGEKAVVVLFLPLLEDQLQANLQRLDAIGEQAGATASSPPEESRVVLIDEPEQHLHPDLQAKILSYMRQVSERTQTQFIVTTHSPTILDQAFEDELYVLTEPTEDPAENQLKKVTTSAERLEALKQLAGSAYFLTTGRVIVCIEGERDADPEKATDARLLALLYPRSSAVTLVPTTGKGNVIATVSRLREHLREETYRLRVKGLVDSDQREERLDGVELLPVCMIENFLLDSVAIHRYLVSIESSKFSNPAEVTQELKKLALAQRATEIALRLRKRIKPRTVRLTGTTSDELRKNLRQEIDQLNAILPETTKLDVLVETETAVVDRIIAEGKELDLFRGKELLNAFYQAHVSSKNISYNKMCIDLARFVKETRSVEEKLDPVFDRLLSE